MDFINMTLNQEIIMEVVAEGQSSVGLLWANEREEQPMTRPQRTRCHPMCYQDELPLVEPPAVILKSVPHVILYVNQPFETVPDKFGLFRRYIEPPSFIPDEETFTKPLASDVTTTPECTIEFKVEDCHGLTHCRVLDLLKLIDENDKFVPWLSTKDKWNNNKTLKITIPEGKQNLTTPIGREVEIHGLHTQSIVEIIQTVYSTSSNIHYTPYELYYKNGNSTQRIYGEIYSSPAYITEHCKLPRVPNCTLERTVAPLMFWSDATHLTSFGTAKLWPIYMCFGSQSKYTRIQLKAGQCHHIAYIPSLPDHIQDIIREFTGGKTTRLPILTHCRRELMQGVWDILLDEEFITSYKEGIIILCPDGITQHIILKTTIRDKGLSPCPRCLIVKNDISQMGTYKDMQNRKSNKRQDTLIRQNHIHKARELIYKKGTPIQSQMVESLLKERSLVPTVNAFSQKLFKFGFDFHKVFIVDFLHEIELGVWKALFTHLIRILHTTHETKVQELNRRYRLIPTFGRDIIRRFANNVAEMKKLAARDFEDILQCSIPAFEGLFSDPLDRLIQDILFVFCSWHGICKLRLHTEKTLHSLEILTQALGRCFRQFNSITADMIIMELPREASARNRRQIQTASEGSRNINPGSLKCKTLNLSTYKFHLIGDYVTTICQFGTIESYSTQAGELQHRTIKRRYLRSARAQIAKSLTTIEAQERHMQSINNQLNPEKIAGPVEHFCYVPPQERYHISSNRTNPLHIAKFLRENKDDIAVKDFYSLLKDHILARLLDLEYDGDEMHFTSKDRNEVFIKNDTIFQHSTCRINFTTYDLRRSQDIINPGYGHSDIMVLAREDSSQKNSHCFWYARVIKIFHLYASHRLPNGELTSERALNFLWVRWFGKDFTYKAGSKDRRLDRIAFISEEDDTESFGLLDPALVLRTAHIIPAFAYGFAEESALSSSKLAHPNSELKDWNYYYVNRFADRDILMHYLGRELDTSLLLLGIVEPNEDGTDDKVREFEMEDSGCVNSGEEDIESGSGTELDETSDDGSDMIGEDFDEGYDTA
ncbi:hypothetical protein Clacol_005462 [Clathrus columnatus]|uniref:Uncharacterized protein n=1 Tax=Clathrus columnatus TaxID=1419009 RepID=A0AAV5AH24_9AGAM|nr:hypothetical protein Clacol_005462 [Clathrus columnatus]